MGVTIKTDGYKILQALGLGGPQLSELYSFGITVEMTTNKLVFKDNHGMVQGTIPVKAGAISMAMDGTLGPSSKQAIGMKAAKMINSIMSKVSGSVPPMAKGGKVNPPYKEADPDKPEPLQSNWHNVPKGDKDKVPPGMKKFVGSESVAVGLDMAEAEAKVAAWHEEFGADLDTPEELLSGLAPAAKGSNLEAIMKANPVQLSDATLMYQPVRGTSGSSIYHVVGLSPDMFIAARLKGATLSVRVEGEVASHQAELQAAGFTMGNLSKGYVSIHLEVEDHIIGNRTLGALLCGMAQPMKTPLPNIKVLAGAGA